MDEKLELIGGIREMIYGEGIDKDTGCFLPGINIRNIVLAHGYFESREFFILNIGGTHPCAYVNALPEDVANMGILEWGSYDDVDPFVDAHGGVTYCENCLKAEGKTYIGNWLGWDYAHTGDYMYSTIDPYDFFGLREHKWTINELLDECKSVIEDLKNLKNSNKEDSLENKEVL